MISTKMDKTLISVPVLCDADCTIVFKKQNIQVFKDNKLMIEGPRDSDTNLCLMPLENDSNRDTNSKQANQSFVLQLKHTANSTYQQQSAATLQAWHYATLGALAVTTLIQAINNNWLTTTPGLTTDGVRKHLLKSIQTTGHTHKVGQNIRSTKVIAAEEIIEENRNKINPSENYLPPQTIINRNHYV